MHYLIKEHFRGGPRGGLRAIPGKQAAGEVMTSAELLHDPALEIPENETATIAGCFCHELH